MIDGTIIRFHQRGMGAKEGQAIGRSRGGLTAKIVALVDAHEKLARFVCFTDSAKTASQHPT